MATCKATYRHYLLNGYGTSPLDASIQFFAVTGNGMEWTNGDLVPSYDVSKVRSFDDYYKATFIDDNLNIKCKLENEARLIKYHWVQKNIEDILTCPVDTSFFQRDSRRNHYVLNVCEAYAEAFNFPDDIQSDWGEALLCFLDWWATQLRMAWRVGYGGTTDHWTPSQLKAAEVIHNSKKRLFKLQTGQDWDEYCEEMRALANDC